MRNSPTTGAKAFLALMQRIGDISDATCGSLDDDALDGLDGRDYPAMAAEVEASIRLNLIGANAKHGEGFLRALTDLLCMTADGAGPGEGWDPLRNTAAAYARLGQSH